MAIPALESPRRGAFLRSEFFRFLAAGSFNTLLTYALYWLLLSVLSYRASYTASFLVGIVLSYLLNCFFVFRRKPTWSAALRFPVVYVVQYVFGVVLLSAFVERLHWSPRFAAAAVTICSVPRTFLLSRLIVAPGTRAFPQLDP